MISPCAKHAFPNGLHDVRDYGRTCGQTVSRDARMPRRRPVRATRCSWRKGHRLLPVDLVIATSAYCDEHLRATMMDMPMIAASRLEGYVVDGDFRGIKHRRQITLSNEILCETIIRIAHRKCTWIVHTPYSTPMQKEYPMSVRHVLP